LVDLARNDLGRVGANVEVKAFKEIQFFSHVIHMVSEVEAKLSTDYNPLEVFGKTFPAGTLSGAPKYKAMQLIDKYEPVSRNYYGGGIGFIELNGNLNHAIMIRSFLSQNNELHYQAGAGVVVNSVPESELKEVDNKIGALRMAIKKAEDIK
jgi:anthranilate synthase component 1